MSETDTSQKIIKAAREIFAEYGLKGARMHQIASRAEVNQALLHYYFKSKEKLYHEVLYYTARQIFQSLSQFLTDAQTIEEGFAQFIRGYIDILKNNPEFPRLMVSEVMQGGDNVIAAMDRVFEEIGFKPPAFIQPLIADAVAEGKIRPVDPMQTTISVVGMSLFYFIGKPLLNHIWGAPEDEDKFLEERKEAIIDLVLYGLLKREKENN